LVPVCEYHWCLCVSRGAARGLLVLPLNLLLMYVSCLFHAPPDHASGASEILLWKVGDAVGAHVMDFDDPDQADLLSTITLQTRMLRLYRLNIVCWMAP
jgi:hypothetical protein